MREAPLNRRIAQFRSTVRCGAKQLYYFELLLAMVTVFWQTPHGLKTTDCFVLTCSRNQVKVRQHNYTKHYAVITKYSEIMPPDIFHEELDGIHCN